MSTGSEVIPAHATIRLLITVHRPPYCRTRQRPVMGSDEFYSGSHRVHWKSLLRSNITTIDDRIAHFRLC
jgi:hypothetical protein